MSRAILFTASVTYPDTAKGRREMVAHLDERGRRERKKSGFVPMVEGVDRRTSHLRHGWYWGRQEFAERTLRLAKRTLGKARRSRSYQASPERVFWLKDEALEESAYLPAPEIIAADIAADLEAALEQFATIAEDLNSPK